MPVQMDDRVTENWFHSSEKGKTGWAKEKISDLIYLVGATQALH